MSELSWTHIARYVFLCIHSSKRILFLFTYFIFIIIHLFICVLFNKIIFNFLCLTKGASSNNTIKTEDIRAFRNEWTKLDPDGTGISSFLLVLFTFIFFPSSDIFGIGLISAKLLPELLSSLPKSLGLVCDCEEMNHNELDILLKSLKLHLFDYDHIHFTDLIVQLSLNVMRRQHDQEFIVPKKKDYLKLDRVYTPPFMTKPVAYEITSADSSKKIYVKYETEFDEDGTSIDHIFEDNYPNSVKAIPCKEEDEYASSNLHFFADDRLRCSPNICL